MSELEYVKYSNSTPMNLMLISLENSSPHWHYEYEVFFVLRGAVTINTESGLYKLEKGDMFLFNSCEIHSVFFPEADNICLVFQFSPGLIKEFYKSSFRFSLNTKLSMPQNPKTVSELQKILAKMGLLQHEKPDGYQFSMKAQIYEFVYCLFRKVKYNIVESKDVTLSNEELEDFNLIKKYIKDHFKENPKQDELCKALGMSRSKVYRLLKSTGTDSAKYLTTYYKIEYAKNLLQNTKASIPYIVVESGFESESSFYRVFKEATGVSPNHYRELPSTKLVPIGIQNYVAYPISDAISLLREYNQQL